MITERKLILFIAMSVDGFIAKSDGDISFLSLVEKSGEDYGYTKFTQGTDTVILGRKTYDKILSMGFQYPHTDKKVYIISHTKKPDIGTFEYYNGDLKTLITNLKSQPGKNIYCDGGAELVHHLLVNNLIDEMVISIIPVLLGDGIKLFKPGFDTQKLKLLNSKQFEKGLVQVHYEVI